MEEVVARPDLDEIEAALNDRNYVNRVPSDVAMMTSLLTYARDLEAECAKASDLATNGLLTDGAHHKQWYLEQILLTLGWDLGLMAKTLEAANNYAWEPGITP